MSRYDEWMRSQPEEYQNDVLGEQHARLFRAGKMQLRRYQPRANDGLTIAQARRRDMLGVFDEGRFPVVSFVNKAATRFEPDLATMVATMQKYLDKFFVPVWGYPARLQVSAEAEPGTWTMLFTDDAESAGALGFHDIAKDGFPVSKVFVAETLRVGQNVSTTVSHELAEMLIDPAAQLWAQNMETGTLHAYEVADAVEGDEFLLDGVWVSNFVHPEFFESFHAPRSTQFDHLNRVERPFETLKDGYQIIMRNGKISEIFGSSAKMRDFENEARALHRSEYRKATSWRGSGSPRQ